MRKEYLLGALVLSAGCGGAAREPPATAAGQPEASKSAAPSRPEVADDSLTQAENVDFCIRLHEQLAACAGEFIDLNIELRTHYFPDFAKRVSTPEARAEARRIGIEEALADGTGPVEPRRQRCTEYCVHGPPTPRSDVPHMEGCYQKPSCADKVECARPILEARYQKKREQGEGQAGH